MQPNILYPVIKLKFTSQTVEVLSFFLNLIRVQNIVKMIYSNKMTFVLEFQEMMLIMRLAHQQKSSAIQMLETSRRNLKQNGVLTSK